jgi:hypothetical protein
VNDSAASSAKLLDVTTAEPPTGPNVRRKKTGATSALHSSDHLAGVEFLRRYKAMPGIKKAELINGIVYVAAPVRADQHADPDGLIQGWLFHYVVGTPGVRNSNNATARLGPDDIPQPDASLRILPEYGGQCRMDEDGYLRGAPEFVAEIAASSVSVDVHEKRDSYRRAGVREYLVWRSEDECIDWWQLEDDEYRPLPIEADGTIHSRVFPGLWLHVGAALALDGARVVEVLDEGLRSAPHAEFVAQLAAKR